MNLLSTSARFFIENLAFPCIYYTTKPASNPVFSMALSLFSRPYLKVCKREYPYCGDFAQLSTVRVKAPRLKLYCFISLRNMDFRVENQPNKNTKFVFDKVEMERFHVKQKMNRLIK
jgi:hypothetical protein